MASSPEVNRVRYGNWSWEEDSNNVMGFLNNLCDENPTTVMVIGVAILILLGIYINLLNTYL